jgi:archaellum biogenesis ATPase FlaH
MSEVVDLSKVGHTACPGCRAKGGDTAGNNLYVYGPEHGAYCHACGYTVRSEERKAEVAEERALGHVVKKRTGGVRSDLRGATHETAHGAPNMAKVATPDEKVWVRDNTAMRGKGWRGIPDAIHELFRARFEYDTQTGEPIAHLMPTTVEGKIVGWKRRIFPKDFSQPIGKADIECDMMGEWLFPTHTRVCLIVGGESKMQSAYSMLQQYYASRGKDEYELPAVVCPTTGETSAFKQIRRRYKFFNRFQKIIVCMDEDDAGHAAAQACAEVLPKGRVHIMTMRFKDADDYVAAGKEHEFISDFFAAMQHKWMPSGILGSMGLSAAIRASISTPGIPLPAWMPKFRKACAGRIPLRTIVNIGSASGTGKSTIVDELVYDWLFSTQYKPGILSLENDAGQYGINILSRHLQVKLNLIESPEDRLAFIDRPDNLYKERQLFEKNGEDRFLLMDERGADVRSVQDKIEEMVISYGCQLIIIDPLQDLMAGLSIEQQEEFMKWQKSLVRAYPIVIVNINHVRKSGNGQKANSTGAALYEEDIAGSSTVFKSGAINLLFTRDKESDDPIMRNTTVFKATKIRHTGITGLMDELYYDNQTHTVHNKEAYFLENAQEF